MVDKTYFKRLFINALFIRGSMKKFLCILGLICCLNLSAYDSYGYPDEYDWDYDYDTSQSYVNWDFWNYCSFQCTNRFWVGAEWIYWKLRNSPKTPPLVIEAASTNNTTLGSPGVTVVMGDEDINTDWRSGVRLTLGGWFDDCGRVGVEASYFYLPTHSHHDSVKSNSNGSPFLGVPYFNIENCQEAVFTLASPGIESGSASFRLKNRMQGAEFNGLINCPYDCAFTVGFIYGFRYWNFQEKLRFDTSTVQFGGGPATFPTFDRFSVRNNFYGGQIGLALDYHWCNFFINLKGKFAIGAVHEKVNINGSNVTTGITKPVSPVGGLFALSSNIGKQTSTRFAVIPEVDLNVGYQFWDCFKVQIGYTFFFVSDMVFATKQMDRVINPSLFPGGTTVAPNNPRPLHKNSSLWVQGLNLGAEFIF